MTRLLLVRHGATSWTGQGRLQGATDIDLCAQGARDVGRLAELVRAEAPTTAIASPLSRARSTERILRERTKCWERPVLDPGWAEHGLGMWEGRTREEIGETYALWRAGRFVPPGAESRDIVRQRVQEAIERAVVIPGPVLVVTHGGVIRMALDLLVGLSPARIHPVAAPSLTIVETAPEGARLAAYNRVG